MKKIIVALLTLSSCSLVFADDALQNTNLFKNIAKECMPVNLTSWNHPTKAVLAKYKVELHSLSLCNRKKYPVYYASLKYDPGTSNTDSFFKPFELDMAQANSWNSFSIIDSENKQILNISVKKHPRTISESYESY